MIDLKTFMDKVSAIYGAIAGLPADNELFSDPGLKLRWVEMLGGPYGGVFNNLGETCENVFNRIGMEWDDFGFTPTGFHEAGDVITVEGGYSGINKNTGKKVNARVIHLWKLVDGEILVEQFTDTALFWNAME